MDIKKPVRRIYVCIPSYIIHTDQDLEERKSRGHVIGALYARDQNWLYIFDSSYGVYNRETLDDFLYYARIRASDVKSNLPYISQIDKSCDILEDLIRREDILVSYENVHYQAKMRFTEENLTDCGIYQMWFQLWELMNPTADKPIPPNIPYHDVTSFRQWCAYTMLTNTWEIPKEFSRFFEITGGKKIRSKIFCKRRFVKE